jgi:hypothetical protein
MKITGARYRRGRALSREAYDYRFPIPDSEDEPAQEVAPDHPVRLLLCALLTDDEIDLLYLGYVAGWSQADVAREWGLTPACINGRDRRLLQKIRSSPLRPIYNLKDG